MPRGSRGTVCSSGSAHHPDPGASDRCAACLAAQGVKFTHERLYFNEPLRKFPPSRIGSHFGFTLPVIITPRGIFNKTHLLSLSHSLSPFMSHRGLVNTNQRLSRGITRQESPRGMAIKKYLVPHLTCPDSLARNAAGLRRCSHVKAQSDFGCHHLHWTQENPPPPQHSQHWGL